MVVSGRKLRGQVVESQRVGILCEKRMMMVWSVGVYTDGQCRVQGFFFLWKSLETDRTQVAIFIATCVVAARASSLVKTVALLDVERLRIFAKPCI